MALSSRILAIIPARGGSKGLPRKNLARLLGKPLIAWTIETAVACTAIDRVVVSTEDEEIATIARYFGAETPFVRPSELAKDDTPTTDVLIHAVEWLNENEAYLPDYIMCLQPTSPLRTTADILLAIQTAHDLRADVVVSVHPVQEHPYWVKRIMDDGCLANFLVEPMPSQRQNLPPAYALNGSIYLYRTQVLLQYRGDSARTYPYIMPLDRSLDIDTPWQLHLAELILKDKLKIS